MLDQYDRFNISSITEFEIRCGITKKQEVGWNELPTEIEVLPFDSLASQLAAQIDQALKRKNSKLRLLTYLSLLLLSGMIIPWPL